MDRLTREEIEEYRRQLCDAEMWNEEGLAEINQLCDLALQSLSQDAVRDEALEEAAMVAELFTEPTILAFYDRPGGPPGNARVPVTGKAHIAPAIRALKREPNAAAKIGQSYEVMGIEQTSAPAAPDVASMVKRLRGCVNDRHDPAVTTCEDIEPLALEAAALLAKLGQGWIPVSERLPECDEVVIVQGGIARHNGKEWKTLTCEPWPGRPIQWEVTHWMPLPPAPGASDD